MDRSTGYKYKAIDLNSGEVLLQESREVSWNLKY